MSSSRSHDFAGAITREASGRIAGLQTSAQTRPARSDSRILRAMTVLNAVADQPTAATPTPTLRIKRLSPHATIPAYQSAEAAGLDLAACLDGGDAHPGLVLEPAHKGGMPVLVPCGFSMALPRGWEGQVRPRSGLASKFAVTLPNAPGTIDSDYRGEVKVPLVNLGREPYVVKHGTRVAQMVIAPVARARVAEVADLDDTARGAGGFGSTGA